MECNQQLVYQSVNLENIMEYDGWIETFTNIIIERDISDKYIIFTYGFCLKVLDKEGNVILGIKRINPFKRMYQQVQCNEDGKFITTKDGDYKGFLKRMVKDPDIKIVFPRQDNEKEK